MYEPAMLGNMMQEEETFKNWAEETEELIRKRKYNMALLRFSKHIGYQDPRSPQKSEEVSLRELDNVEYAFNKEIPVLLRYYPDIDKMNQHADKITIAAGEKSEDSWAGLPPVWPSLSCWGPRVCFRSGCSQRCWGLCSLAAWACWRIWPASAAVKMTKKIKMIQ